MGTSAALISSATLLSTLSVIEALQDVAGAEGETVPSDSLNPTQSTYTPTSSPPGKYYSSQSLALVAGAATINLTALPGLQAAIDGTGLKLNVLRIRGELDGSNAKLTVSEGAANPYELFGAANPMEYPAGCRTCFTFEFDDALADIAAGAKNIDLAGTGTDSFFVEIIVG